MDEHTHARKRNCNVEIAYSAQELSLLFFMKLVNVWAQEWQRIDYQDRLVLVFQRIQFYDPDIQKPTISDSS